MRKVILGIKYFSKKVKQNNNDSNYFLESYDSFKLPKEEKELINMSDSLFKKNRDKNPNEFYGQDTIINIKNIKPQDAYKLIDTTFESYFADRDYNLANFNNLLFALSEQSNLQRAIEVFEKMKILNISPNAITYVNLIQNHGKNYKINEAISLFEKAEDMFGPSRALLNSIVFSFSRNHMPEEAEKLVRQYKIKGFNIDTV